MRLSKEFFYTLREDVSDEESISGNLLVKAGYFKKVSSGIYLKLPLGIKVKENVEKIVRKHMDKVASQVIMPNLIPMDIFEKSGRKDIFGSEMFRLNDRYDRQYALGPTDEEIFVETAKSKIKSYKDCGFTIYQLGTKYRDEIRPRLGLIRTREFTMKDAYSFDKSDEMLDETYKKVYQAYIDIFNELGLDYVVVKADTGAMGGKLSEEFQALCDVGEDIVVTCPSCGFASNIEVCECINDNKNQDENISKLNIEKVHTPNVKTIEDVSKYLNIDIKNCIKAIAYNIDGNLVLAFIPGDKTLNETKLQKIYNAQNIEIADEKLLKDNNINAGFIGPIGHNCQVIIDNNILNMSNFVIGSNENDYHYINANIEDIKYSKNADIINIEQGDLCPICKSKLEFRKAVEVGNTFKLGTKYSEALNLEYLDENNKKNPVIMGCYGIGIERTIAAIVEQNNDEKGISWPVNIAPYKVAIVLINPKDETQINLANDLHDSLEKLGIDTILDDRDQRPGVKFNDMDLIGIPYRITVGKKAVDNIVELKKRTEQTSIDISANDVIENLKNIIHSNS